MRVHVSGRRAALGAHIITNRRPLMGVDDDLRAARYCVSAVTAARARVAVRRQVGVLQKNKWFQDMTTHTNDKQNFKRFSSSRVLSCWSMWHIHMQRQLHAPETVIMTHTHSFI